MIGVVTHQRRQVEGDGKSATSVLQQVAIPFVGFFRRSESRELAHRPETATIPAGMDAASVGSLSRIVQVFLKVLLPVFRKVSLCIESPDRHTRYGRKSGISIVVTIHSTISPDGALGRLLER